MTYVVVESCIKCKYMDCVEVCPVDCFYEGENMLVIHPDECIDCGVCELECPVDASSLYVPGLPALPQRFSSGRPASTPERFSLKTLSHAAHSRFLKLHGKVLARDIQ